MNFRPAFIASLALIGTFARANNDTPQLIDIPKISESAAAPMKRDLSWIPPNVDDSELTLRYFPEDLWRGASGEFKGRREDGKIVLTYDFLNNKTYKGTRYSGCPSKRGDLRPAPNCEAIQAAVGKALDLWASAAGNLVIRRRGSSVETVNIWIAWTDFSGESQFIGRALDNTRDPNAQDPPLDEPNAAGFAKPTFPRGRKSFASLFFNDTYCWYLDRTDCPANAVHPSGKEIETSFSIPLVTLHESGHVLGFGHFGGNSIMGISGGSQRYALTPIDREAIAILYRRVAALPER